MSKKPRREPQLQYYVNILGRELTWQEAWHPSTIMKDDHGRPIKSYWDWKRGGGDDESLYRNASAPARSSPVKSTAPQVRPQSPNPTSARSAKTSEAKYIDKLGPKSRWLMQRLGRDLRDGEALYPAMTQMDDQGRPIVWPSDAELEKMFNPPPRPVQQNGPPTPSRTPQRSANPTTPAVTAQQSQAKSDNHQPFGNKHFKVECGLNEQDRLKFKIEQSGFFHNKYRYVYDLKGRLLAVYKNDRLEEEYEYNELGQRTQQYCSEKPPAIYLKYNPEGQLIRMGDARFEYDKHGALSRKIYDPPHGIGGGETRYFYNGDTRLDRVILPNGDEVAYKYGRGEMLQAQNPLQKFKNGKLVREYEWQDPFRLAACLDHEKQLEFHFSYGERLCPESVRIKEYQPRPNQAEFLCGCDQVGTLKVLANKPNAFLTYIDYDSFGNVLSDSSPRRQCPIGFAGGLIDHDIGLVRFGYRDYDPTCGRFTCPDPLGETGGDHDLYDYCVDDPVSSYDPSGLIDYPAWKNNIQPSLGKLPRTLGWVNQKAAGAATSYVGKKITKEGGLFFADIGMDVAGWAADAIATMMTHDGNIFEKVGAVLSGQGSTQIREQFNEGRAKTAPIVKDISNASINPGQLLDEDNAVLYPAVKGFAGGIGNLVNKATGQLPPYETKPYRGSNYSTSRYYNRSSSSE